MLPSGSTSSTATGGSTVSGASRPRSARADLSGPVLFARYAFGPNRLGLCGPADWPALRQLGSAADGDSASRDHAKGARTLAAEGAIRELARGFEGAYPYLRLIADSNGISDPLDRAVVDAYWLGNRLSDRVEPSLMARSLSERFEARVASDEWRWLAAKPMTGARPTHAFHVLDVFPRAGLMNGGDVSDALALMQSCRIRWGTVLDVGAERLVVDAPALEMSGGKLRLSEPRVGTVSRWLDAPSDRADIRVGDVVSLHWDWACEVLVPARARALMSRTRAQMRITNETI